MRDNRRLCKCARGRRWASARARQNEIVLSTIMARFILNLNLYLKIRLANVRYGYLALRQSNAPKKKRRETENQKRLRTKPNETKWKNKKRKLKSRNIDARIVFSMFRNEIHARTKHSAFAISTAKWTHPSLAMTASITFFFFFSSFFRFIYIFRLGVSPLLVLFRWRAIIRIIAHRVLSRQSHKEFKKESNFYWMLRIPARQLFYFFLYFLLFFPFVFHSEIEVFRCSRLDWAQVGEHFKNHWKLITNN